MTNNRILAFSSSRVGDGGYLEAVAPIVNEFLGGSKLQVAFLPFASVANDAEAYAEMVTNGLNNPAYQIKIVQPEHAKEMVETANVIMVGGGNTFKLLYDIYQLKLLDIIRDKVNKGIPYIGWSAGANILGPSIGTTNDMPIVEPKSFNALGLFPFQINPHYNNEKPSGHNGETRDQRLQEFLKMNPGVPIVALPEGTALKMQDAKLQFLGIKSGLLFSAAENEMERKEIDPGTDISFLF